MNSARQDPGLPAGLSRYLDELAEFLAIPSVSADPSAAPDIRRAADWVAGALRSSGLRQVTVFETGGNPVVYGEHLEAADAPTVLCYGHYDVQPPDPRDAWTSPPFEPTLREGRLYARGATDDKGQLFIHLKAVEACLNGAGLPVNIKFVIEGEEEIGCPHFLPFVEVHRDLLAADVAVISDTAMLSETTPSLTCALRGIAAFELSVRTAAEDLHSGSFGGAVPNAAGVLVRLLASLVRGDGTVSIPGFYDDVAPLTGPVRRALRDVPLDEGDFLRAAGVRAPAGEPGYSTLERLWYRPAMDVNGMVAGHTGAGMKTVIPSVASAKLSFRLVPDQDPERVGDLLEQHLATVAPAGASVTLRRGSRGRPWRAGEHWPYTRAAARAVERAFGKAPVLAGEGGSNPVVVALESTLGVPVIMLGIGLPTDGAHAPDEHLSVDRFARGVEAARYLYQEIARPPSPPQ